MELPRARGLGARLRGVKEKSWKDGEADFILLLLFETETVYAAQDGLECLTFLPQPPATG